MTVEEIKQSLGMADILRRYGLSPNRAKFIRCPFHNEKSASMKIYVDSYHCFGCGEHGDIFSFVQKMDGCDFKTAYLSLGGEYQKESSFASRLAIYKAKKQREMAKKAESRERAKRVQLNARINELRIQMASNDPLSDPWCDAYKKLQYQYYLHGEMTGLPY